MIFNAQLALSGGISWGADLMHILVGYKPILCIDRLRSHDKIISQLKKANVALVWNYCRVP